MSSVHNIVKYLIKFDQKSVFFPSFKILFSKQKEASNFHRQFNCNKYHYFYLLPRGALDGSPLLHTCGLWELGGLCLHQEGRPTVAKSSCKFTRCSYP